MTLQHALDVDQLVVHYQPQVEVLTGRVTAVEALARWQHPTLGLLPPGRFVPQAEADGLIGALTARVLDVAAVQARSWRATGWPVRVAVNLSANDLTDATLVDTVTSTLERHGLPGTAIELEITETAALSDAHGAAATLAELDRLGVDTVLDDYGTGYSTLAYLKQFPVRRVKLDRSLVSDLAAEHTDQVIVRSTLQLARDLGLGVVAEGVEDVATFLLLRHLGCDTAQGFGLCRPTPANELGARVQALEARLAAVPST